MAAWVIPQNNLGCDPQHQAHWFPRHTLAAAIGGGEVTNCNLMAQQLLLGTPTQQAGKPTDVAGKVCGGCAMRPAVAVV